MNKVLLIAILSFFATISRAQCDWQSKIDSTIQLYEKREDIFFKIKSATINGYLSKIQHDINLVDSCGNNEDNYLFVKNHNAYSVQTTTIIKPYGVVEFTQTPMGGTISIWGFAQYDDFTLIIMDALGMFD